MNNLLLVAPRTSEQVVFHYTGLVDLSGLIRFVGKTPQINEDLSLSFKKQVIKEGDVLFRNSFGDVTNVLTFEKFEENYEVKSELEFTDEYKNNIVPKPPKTPKAKKAPKATKK